MVAIKIAAVLLFVFGAAHAVKATNLHPFLPNGFPGVISGASVVFFAFIGFDSVSTAAEECREPQRNMPIGIIGTLIICGLLYTAVALVLTGIVNWKTLGNAAPVANALEAIGMNKLRFTRHGRRAAGHAVFPARLPIRPGAGLVCHVARPPAARLFLKSPPQIPDAACQHVAGRTRRGHTGRHLGYRNFRRFIEYWDLICLHHRLNWSGDTAAGPAQPATLVPGAVYAHDVGVVGALLPGIDARIAAGDLDSLRALADNRIIHLLSL